MKELQKCFIAIVLLLTLFCTNITFISQPGVFKPLYAVISTPDSFGWSDKDRIAQTGVIIWEMNSGGYQFHIKQNLVSFTSNELLHMTEVKQLLQLTKIGSVFFTVLVLTLFSHLITQRKFQRISDAFWYGLNMYIGAFALCSIGLAFFWQTSFTFFHQMLFPNGNWAFPIDSTLIRLFSEVFWQRLFFVCLTLPVLELFFGFLFIKQFYQKQKHT